MDEARAAIGRQTLEGFDERFAGSGFTHAVGFGHYALELRGGRQPCKCFGFPPRRSAFSGYYLLVMRVVLLLALLGSVARADTAAVPAGQVEQAPKKESSLGKWVAAGSIAAFHGVYLTWQYFAWYRKGSEPFHTEGPYDAFAASSFSGGADKLGHTWGNYAMTRGTTAVLVAGGFPKLPSSLVSFGLTELAYLLIEIQDGMAPYGFGTKDLAANLIGGAFAVLMDNVPAVDRWLDFRLEYWPSSQYRKNVVNNGDVDGAQDYTGQSYILALHTSAIPGLADKDWGYWSRFVDVAVGFEAKHYYPTPDERFPRQTLYAGLAINMQGVLSHLFDDSRGRRVGRGLFEVYSLPYTTLRFAEASRSPIARP